MTVPELPDVSVVETLRGDVEAAAKIGSVDVLRRIIQAFLFTGLRSRVGK